MIDNIYMNLHIHFCMCACVCNLLITVIHGFRISFEYCSIKLPVIAKRLAIFRGFLREESDRNYLKINIKLLKTYIPNMLYVLEYFMILVETKSTIFFFFFFWNINILWLSEKSISIRLVNTLFLFKQNLIKAGNIISMQSIFALF